MIALFCFVVVAMLLNNVVNKSSSKLNSWERYIDKVPTKILRYGGKRYGCHTAHGQCYWGDLETAKAKCLRWNRCKALYCTNSLSEARSYLCFARGGKGELKYEKGATAHLRVPGRALTLNERLAQSKWFASFEFWTDPSAPSQESQDSGKLKPKIVSLEDAVASHRRRLPHSPTAADDDDNEEDAEPADIVNTRPTSQATSGPSTPFWEDNDGRHPTEL